MSQPRTLSFRIAAMLLLICIGFASAQAVDCDNSNAESVIQTNDEGEPATSQSIIDNFRPTIGGAHIIRCLIADRPLVNHFIDFNEYVVAWENTNGQTSELVIEDSVLWLPHAGTVELSNLSIDEDANREKKRVVNVPIRWVNVVLGPEVSGRNVVFEGNIDFTGSIFHGQVNFIGAEFRKVAFDDVIFNGIARFYSGTTFRGPASFRGVQFRGEAFFHNKTMFHDKASFAGATFDGKAYDYREAQGEAYFHAGTAFLDEVSFEGATFNAKPHFSADTFSFRNIASFKSASFESASFKGASFKGAVFNVEAAFGGIIFPGPAWFQNADFNMGASFQDAVFHQQAIFDGALFRQYVDFDGVNFGERAKVSFGSSIFEVEAAFGAIAFPGPASFQGAQFNMGFSLQEAEFRRQVDFSGAQFSQHLDLDSVEFGEGAEVSFDGSIFNVDAAFGGVTFPGPASFQGAQFNMGFSLQEAEFRRQVDFSGAQFSQHLDLDSVEFGEGAEVSFDGSIFNVDAAFGGVTFPGPVSFQNAQFNTGASFQNAVFIQQANFEGATFAEDLSFRDAVFKGTLQLVDTTWEGRADFRRSAIGNLNWDSENRPSTVKGVFDARGATLKSFTIKDIHFSDLADFSDTVLGEAKRNVTFDSVIFEKAADFLRADFQGDAIFVRSRFHGLWDFTAATFQNGANLCLSFNRISNLVMEREHLYQLGTGQWFPKLRSPPSLEKSRVRSVSETTHEKVKSHSCAGPNPSRDDPEQQSLRDDTEDLHRIYYSIESSFRNAKDRWGENEAWYLRTVANRKREGGIRDIVLGILLDFPSRYGIDYERVFVVSGACVLLFWFVYWLYFRCVFLKTCQGAVKLAAAPEQRSALRFRPFERIFYGTAQEKRALRPCIDALLLSWRAFFKLGLGSSYPPVLAWLVYIEWVVGMYMLIHFLFVLKNNLPIALPFLNG